MKELSIEEKAKRYDEALKKAKNYHSPETVCNVRIAMENLFPELKESGDEKIRKALIKLVKKVGEGYENVIEGVSIENAISWLEKQGKHTAIPADKIEPKFKVCDVICSSNGTMMKIVGITDYCYNCVICSTNDEYSFGFDIQDEFVLVEDKKEWSEEDEKIIDAIYSCVDSYYDGLAKTSLLIWLKSLRPQNTWKPSDEQMNAIEYILSDVYKPQDIHSILKELLEQLKAL